MLTAFDVENLGRSVTASGHKATIPAETHAAHDTLMGKVMDQLDIEHPTYTGIEDSIPVFSLAFQVRRESVNGEINKLVTAAA